MTALPQTKSYEFHFFQQPHSEILRNGNIRVRLTRYEATGMYRWLKRMLRLSDENVWITMPARPAGVDKSTGRLHFNNVLTLERWRSPHMTRTKAPAGRTHAQDEFKVLGLTGPLEPAREPNLRARFRPLAESRTAAVIGALDYLGQLSQRARYRYTDEEIEDIEAGIVEKLTETMDAFRRGVGNRPGFKFRSAPKPE